MKLPRQRRHRHADRRPGRLQRPGRVRRVHVKSPAPSPPGPIEHHRQLQQPPVLFTIPDRRDPLQPLLRLPRASRPLPPPPPGPRPMSALVQTPRAQKILLAPRPSPGTPPAFSPVHDAGPRGSAEAHRHAPSGAVDHQVVRRPLRQGAHGAHRAPAGPRSQRRHLGSGRSEAGSGRLVVAARQRAALAEVARRLREPAGRPRARRERRPARVPGALPLPRRRPQASRGIETPVRGRETGRKRHRPFHPPVGNVDEHEVPALGSFAPLRAIAPEPYQPRAAPLAEHLGGATAGVGDKSAADRQGRHGTHRGWHRGVRCAALEPSAPWAGVTRPGSAKSSTEDTHE